LLRSLLPLLSESPVSGIVTYAIPQKEVWLEESATGERAVIGRFDETLGGTENRMRPLEEGFDRLGISALARLAASDGEWVFLDEIGYLESSSLAYCEAIQALFATKRVAAVVRAQKLPFLEEVKQREDAFVVDLNAPFGRQGCVIMASGEGRRFGSNKLMVDFGGEPMICRALAATEGIFAERVVVTRHREVEALCRERGVSVILHDLPDRNDTVRLGIGHMGQEMDACMFIPADQPCLTHKTVETMALCASRTDSCIWRAGYGEREGAPVIFPRCDFAALSALPKGKGGGVIMKRCPDRVRVVAAEAEAELEDVDTQEDWHRLLSLL
jgi:molybdenum cofactor cytidylyltransferase